MNPKVEFLKKYIQRFAPYIDVITLAGYVFYEFVGIGLCYIWFNFFETGYSKSSFFYINIFLFSFMFMPYSAIRFLFTKNKDKIHKMIFYIFSLPFIICSFFAILILYIIDSLNTLIRINVVLDNIFGLFLSGVLILIFLQPLVGLYFFFSKQKITNDIIFLYMLPAFGMMVFLLIL